jgi:hypothetical protein
MSNYEVGKKLAIIGVIIGVGALLLRLVGGGDDDDSIDRIETGAERNEEPVDTGLDRVETADTDEDSEDTSMLPVEAEGRFDNLDLFDYISILTAALKAAKSEYESRM